MGPRQYRRRNPAGGRSGPLGRRWFRGLVTLSQLNFTVRWWRIRPRTEPVNGFGVVDESQEHRRSAFALLLGGGGSGWSSGWLLGPVGCDGRPSCTPGLSTWSSSRSLHGQLANGNLVSEGASRLDAFSAYPFPTWLPDDAPSGTAGTPEVGPPQSSRTRGDPSQVSDAHGR